MVGRDAPRDSTVRQRILVVSWPPSMADTMPDVFVELVDRGAELAFATKKREFVPRSLVGHPRVRGCALPLRRNREDRFEVDRFRYICDFAWALSLDDAPWTKQRAAWRVLSSLEHPDVERLAGRAAGLRLPRAALDSLNGVLTGIEMLLPPVPGLEGALAELEPDVVFLVTRCGRDGPERDVIKACRRLAIPSALLVWSWDNLSSKAVLNVHPDRMLVWNDVQAREAVDLHGLRRDSVAVVGAPNFDAFFEEIEVERKARTKENAAEPTILYLGSSTNVVPREPPIVDRWLDALRSSEDPRLRTARVLVRPHPGKGTRAFESWRPPEGCVLLTPHSKKARLAQALLDADVVVALNTSAEIEAAIAGCPVLTFRAGPEAPGQEGSAHFRYLLEDHGGFVIDAADLDEHVARLGAVLRGEHDAAALRRAVGRFVRPAGMDRAVAPAIAATISELAVPQIRLAERRSVAPG